MSFNQVLGIQSKRTPDVIEVIGNKVIIIEFAVTVDFNKALETKGND